MATKRLAGRAEWSRRALTRRGFEGWIPVPRLLTDAVLAQEGAVYLIYRATAAAPRFRRVSPGGHFKGRDPTVDREALLGNWVPGARVVYIGKADELRTRLRAYMRFGQGVPIGHWGGRLIWQLADADKLLVAWRYISGQVPAEFEQDLIAEFKAAHGKKPFANDPHLLGS